MLNYKYSIIVTFYNAEKYIRKTLNNLKKLLNDDVEIIIVDDGSTDNTLEVIQTIKINNSKIIHKKNGGVSSARNEGLSNANGEYVIFLDGDDWLDPNIFKELEKFYEKKYDVIKFGFIFVNENDKNYYQITDSNVLVNRSDMSSIINTLLCTPKYNSASNQLIKRELLIEKNIKFLEGIKYAEDFNFNLRLYECINSIYLIHSCYYFYYQNDNGTTKLYEKENVLKCLDDSLTIYTNSIDYFKKNNNSDYLFYDALDRVFNEIVGCLKKLYSTNNLSSNEIKKIIINLYNDKRYIKLYKLLIDYNYIPKGLFNKLIYNKRILFVYYAIFLIKKIKRK